jgi:hypothetical protein
VAIWVVVSSSCVCTGAQGQNPPPQPVAPSPFDLLEAAQSQTPLFRPRPDDGIITLDISYSGTEEITAEAQTTIFTSENGSLNVDILAECGSAASKRGQSAKITLKPNAINQLCLLIPPLPTSAKYTGQLIVSAPNVAPMVRSVQVAQPAVPKGVLVLDHTAISRTVAPATPLEILSRRATASDSLVLREKSGLIALKGISVRLEQLSTAPDGGFDLKKNIEFHLDGHPVDLATNPAAGAGGGSRAIAIGGQSVVELRLHDLEPGDYAAVLRFTASNSSDDDAQKLAINIHVRDSVWWALGCVVIALVMSLAGTKIFTSARRQAQLLNLIHSLRSPSLCALRPIAATVAVRAILYQAEKLSSRFWLTSLDLIENRVNDAKRMIDVLGTVHQLRDDLEAAFDPLIFKRADIALYRVVPRWGTSSLTDPALQAITAQLSAFKDSWLRDDKFVATFWSDIHSDVRALHSEVDSTAVNHVSEARDLVDDLKEDLTKALEPNKPPATRADVEYVYRQWAKLKILWDNRHPEDLRPLIEPAKKNDIERLFRLADRRLWERIKTQHLAIEMPVINEPDQSEAYRLLEFSVKATNPTTAGSYLFLHKIEYWWEFTLETENTGKEGAVTVPPLRPRSLGPSVVQYFPVRGNVTVSVKPVYNLDESRYRVESAGRPLTITESSDFQPYQILELTEFTSWLIAAVIAIASGLLMFYYKEASWGTYKDYLTLFLWGVGIDQGKNFLQALQSFSGQPASPPAPSTK